MLTGWPFQVHLLTMWVLTLEWMTTQMRITAHDGWQMETVRYHLPSISTACDGRVDAASVSHYALQVKGTTGPLHHAAESNPIRFRELRSQSLGLYSLLDTLSSRRPLNVRNRIWQRDTIPTPPLYTPLMTPALWVCSFTGVGQFMTDWSPGSKSSGTM